MLILLGFNLVGKAQTVVILPQYHAFLNGDSTIRINYDFFPGDTMRLVLKSYGDPDSIYVSSADLTTMLPGATLTTDNAKKQTAYITWIPTAAQVTLARRVFNVKFKGNTLGSVTCVFSARANKQNSITLNNGPVNLNQDIELEPGIPMNLRFSSVNPALANAFTISSNVASVLPGATFTTDNATQQTANINFTPTTAQINAQPYTFTVTYQDNAPVPNPYVYTVNVKVRNAMLGVTKTKLEETSFVAYPNPFSEYVTFRLNEKVKAEKIVIYNLLGQQIDQINLPPALNGIKEAIWTKANQFAKGTYLACLLLDNKQIQTIRFVKQ